MHVKQEKILAVYDDKGQLANIVVFSEAKRSQIFYEVQELGAEGIESLLTSKNSSDESIPGSGGVRKTGTGA